MSPATLPALDIIHWTFIFELLSMERVEPFLPLIGLGMVNAEVMRNIARQFLEEEKVALDRDAESALKNRAFERIAEELGSETANQFIEWGVNDSFIDQSTPYYGHYWTNILSRLAGVYEERISPPSLSEDTVNQIRQIIRDQLGDSHWELRERIEEMEPIPATPWEEALYKEYQELGDKDHIITPWIHLFTLLSDRGLCHSLRAIRALLSMEEFEIFMAWAIHEAKALGAPTIELPSCV